MKEILHMREILSKWPLGPAVWTLAGALIGSKAPSASVLPHSPTHMHSLSHMLSRELCVAQASPAACTELF
jgi:hypothetical protein